MGPERAPRRRALLFEEDVRKPLESPWSSCPATFQDKLGDYRQKTARIQDLAEEIARLVGRADLVESVRTAALLSKADLTTLVVKEFTDLQGIMGGIYARRERYPDAVWKAVYDQYKPASSRRTPSDGGGSDLSMATGWTRWPAFRTAARRSRTRRPRRQPSLRLDLQSRANGGRLAAACARRGRSIRILRGPSREVVAEMERSSQRLRNLLERRGASYDGSPRS